VIDVANTGKELAAAQARVERFRRDGSTPLLAEALETYARALLATADLPRVASVLVEAANCWHTQSDATGEGSCLLLAASTYRLAGDLTAADAMIKRAEPITLSSELQQGFALERCEQALAAGRAHNAHACFTLFFANYSGTLAPLLNAQLLQRRAAAAIGCERWGEAAADLNDAADILATHAKPADAEAARLAAAAALANFDAQGAERILSSINATVAQDGAAAARRGLVSGQIAMLNGNTQAALNRFDSARQGALDAGDALSYFAASVQASAAAEAMGDDLSAYARLATAWASLSDVLGRETAADMIRPALFALRDRVGQQRFLHAKQQYESQRRQDGSTKRPNLP
jgi:hypothetical protein